MSEATAERVAQTVAGISIIGHAWRALESEGWTAVICGQRITVNDCVEAHFCGVNGHAWWDVYPSDGSGPVFTVGAHPVDQSTWAGAE
jgi:hypothetical protein